MATLWQGEFFMSGILCNPGSKKYSFIFKSCVVFLNTMEKYFRPTSWPVDSKINQARFSYGISTLYFFALNIFVYCALFRYKRFALNEMFQRNASKFAIFYVQENPCSLFRFSFRAILYFYLMNVLHRSLRDCFFQHFKIPP